MLLVVFLPIYLTKVCSIFSSMNWLLAGQLLFNINGERVKMEKKSGSIQCTGEKECQLIEIRVNRRELLTLAIIATGLAISPFVLPSLGRSTTVELVLHGKPVKMKGTPTGKILSSLDDGRTWEVAADFGADCPVLSMRSASPGLNADIGHKGYSFTLHSVDGRQWSA